MTRSSDRGTPSRELLERLLLDFLLRDSIRVFTDDIRYMSSVKLFWCEFYNKYEIQLTTYYHTHTFYINICIGYAYNINHSLYNMWGLWVTGNTSRREK